MASGASLALDKSIEAQKEESIMDDPSALKVIHQRLIAILTAHLACDTPTERGLAKDILEDNMLLVQSFASLQRLTFELIHFLAIERRTSPEDGEIGDFRGYPESRAYAELLIDGKKDQTVLDGEKGVPELAPVTYAFETRCRGSLRNAHFG
jgi:hypothetical protein